MELMQRLQCAFGTGVAPQHTKITDAMMLGKEADDEAVRALLGMADFAAFEGHVQAGNFVGLRVHCTIGAAT
eukprot:SAG11_NODE_11939_length_730_cov_1.713154_1_plen_72_part_00